MKAPTEHFKIDALWMKACGLDPAEGQVFPILRMWEHRQDQTFVAVDIASQPNRVEDEWILMVHRGQFVTVIKRRSPCLNIDTLVEGGRV